MRRYASLILLAPVLVLPFVLRHFVARGGASSSAAGSGSARLVIITPHNQDIRREFAWAFSDWHQQHYGRPTAVDYRTPGGTTDIKRQLEATYRRYRDSAGNLPAEVPADIDIVWGGGDYTFDRELKPLGVLQPVTLDAKLMRTVYPQPRLAGVKLYDQQGGAEGKPLPPTWVGVCLSSFGIVYNADVYHTLGSPPPKTWSDLTDPRLAGWVALADPSHSGSAAVAYQMVIQRAMADAEAEYSAALPKGADGKPPPLDKKAPAYLSAIAEGWRRGMATLVMIAANGRYFTDSSPLVPNDVGNGEAAAGMAIDFYGRVYEETVGPDRCKYVVPVAATAITPDPVAILKGVKGQQLELATHFIEFLLSPEGQRLWILKAGTPGGPRDRSLRRPPIRPDLYADRAGWTDDLNPYAEAGGFNQRGEWMALFTDTRTVWSAAWIDARVEMKEAYRKILAVPDLSRRAALILELATLPVTMEDVAQAQKQREAMEHGTVPGDVDEANARRRIDWAKRFRKHYRTIGSKA